MRIVIARDANMLHYFLVDEVVDRIASDKTHRNGAWYDGFKIYLPTLLVGTLPWLPIATWIAWKNQRTPKTLWRTSAVFRWLAWCFCLPLIVFMISRSRLPLYILPLFPVLACAVALAIGQVNARRTWIAALLIVWTCALVGGRAASTLFDARDDDKKLAQALCESCLRRRPKSHSSKSHRDTDCASISIRPLSDSRFPAGANCLHRKRWSTKFRKTKAAAC